MAKKTNLPAGFTSKTNFQTLSGVAAGQKLNATTEWNLGIQDLADTSDENYERLLLNWDTDVIANQVIALGQYVDYLDVNYRCTTSYDVGAGKTFTGGNFQAIGSTVALQDGSGTTLNVDQIDLGGVLSAIATIRKNNGITFQILKQAAGDDGEFQQFIMSNSEFFLQYQKDTEISVSMGMEKTGTAVQGVGGLYILAVDGTGSNVGGIGVLKNGSVIVGDLGGLDRFEKMYYRNDNHAKWALLSQALQDRILPDIGWTEDRYIKLSGTQSLTGNVILDGSTVGLFYVSTDGLSKYTRFDATNGNDKQFLWVRGNFIVMQSEDTVAGHETFVSANPTILELSNTIDGGTNYAKILLNNGAIIIEDDNLKGAVYNADYSALGALDDRWIPDKGWVELNTSLQDVTDRGATTDNSIEISENTNAIKSLKISNTNAGSAANNLLQFVNDAGSAFIYYPSSGYVTPELRSKLVFQNGASLGHIWLTDTTITMELSPVGVLTPATGHGLSELSTDPSDPAEGKSIMWQSDGTGSGDDGDIMMKITAGAVTKTTTLVDFSAI